MTKKMRGSLGGLDIQMEGVGARPDTGKVEGGKDVVSDAPEHVPAGEPVMEKEAEREAVKVVGGPSRTPRARKRKAPSGEERPAPSAMTERVAVSIEVLTLLNRLKMEHKLRTGKSLAFGEIIADALDLYVRKNGREPVRTA